MEINKKELRKISRKFRALASNVIHAHYSEQNVALQELLNYVDGTPLLSKYIKSLDYPIEQLEEHLDDINASYGREALNLGSDSDKRIFLLYRAFSYIVEKEMPTYHFGWYYTGRSDKYRDMAKAFGDRLVYPFTTGVELYLTDIATDMGYDDDSSFNIVVKSSGVQVNIAKNHSKIDASQKNIWNSQELTERIDHVERLINEIEDKNQKMVLTEDLHLLKSEISESNPKTPVLRTCLRSMYLVASSIAMIPDLATGLSMIAKLLGISI